MRKKKYQKRIDVVRESFFVPPLPREGTKYVDHTLTLIWSLAFVLCPLYYFMGPWSGPSTLHFSMLINIEKGLHTHDPLCNPNGSPA